jgi:hypothetical protein
MSVSPCLEVLKWAREHGCPWNEWASHFLAVGGHLAVLQWALEHDCPMGARQGLTLVHYLAQPESFLIQNTPRHPLQTPPHTH